MHTLQHPRNDTALIPDMSENQPLTSRFQAPEQPGHSPLQVLFIQSAKHADSKYGIHTPYFKPGLVQGIQFLLTELQNGVYVC